MTFHLVSLFLRISCDVSHGPGDGPALNSGNSRKGLGSAFFRVCLSDGGCSCSKTNVRPLRRCLRHRERVCWSPRRTPLFARRGRLSLGFLLGERRPSHDSLRLPCLRRLLGALTVTGPCVVFCVLFRYGSRTFLGTCIYAVISSDDSLPLCLQL